MKENIYNRGNSSNKCKTQTQLITEYDSLKQYSPSGIYTIPSPSNSYIWHSIIFVRQGYYKNGVFPFDIEIPKDYPSSRPSIFFKTFVFHPLIDPDTGQLSLDCKFENWMPGKDFIFSILAYIKHIFYFQDLWTITRFLLNPRALDCALNEPDVFAREAQSCVNLALNESEGFFQFKEFNSVHNIILNNIKKCKQRPSEFIKYFKDNFI